MPAVSPSFLKEYLSSLSTSQLKEILADEEVELKVFSELPQVKRLLTDRQELYDVCEHLAREYKFSWLYQPKGPIVFF